MTGSDLRVARVRLALTQQQFAALLGVTRNTVARWERGELTIKNPTLLAARVEQLLREHGHADRPNK